MGGCLSKAEREAPYKTAAAAEYKPLDVIAGKAAPTDAKPSIDSAAVDSSLILNVLDHENGPAKGLPYQVCLPPPP
ncbi:hypothetical protein TSOC_006215, partial [Tetrabaena socialis]